MGGADRGQRDEEPGDGTDYIYYTIDEFTVYTAHDYVPKRGGDDVFPFKYPYEMIRLSALKIAQHINYVLVDGFLVNDQGERKYVEKMRVDCLSVGYSGGLGEPALWLQSMSNSELAVRNNRRWHGQTPLEHKRGLVWYQLGKPADVYKRYFDPFVWLATFGVYFFGFLESRWGDVGLLDFEQRFETWLRGKVEGADKAAEECFRAWIECVNDKVDFRIHVASHKEWLWNQMHSMDEFIAKFQHLTLWREIHSMDAIKRAYRGDHEPLTVVTPYVFKVFESMYGEHLKCVKPVPPPGATPKKFLLAGVVIETPSPKKLLKQPFVPKVGDVIWTSPDTTGKWKDKKPAEDQEPEKRWYAWITRIEWNKIYVVWLYKPSETILCVGDYPWPNELFFSDHCNCDSESGAMLMSEVAEKVEVVFHPKPGEEQEAEFFVRQKYRTNNPAFLTLRRSDVVLGNCACWEEELAVGSYAKARNDWVPGNSILYLPKRAKVLEPAIVVSFDDEDQAITIRYLKRLGSLQRGAVVPENEIVWTEEFEDIKAPAIHRRCFIRVFTHGEKVAAPYDRGGSGDMFYIRSEALRLHDGTESVVPFMRDNLREDELRQGFRLGEPPVKPMLRGMDLFCGGGNFGRGLEEGGVVSMKYAVDFDAAPLHSYRANMKHLDDTKLYLGSINNYLKDSIKGKFSDVVPAWDQVDFISAGSPCQGFSLANNHKGSANAIRKQSLVCSLATAIDIYRPKYAVLENVRGIAASRKRPDGGEDNTFTTMLCAVVGMGYQIESFLCDAWSHGNCQSRNRLILAITKAGACAGIPCCCCCC